MPSKGSAGGYLNCPLCDAEVPISSDVRIGEDVFCPYCSCPLKLRKTKTDELYLQEDI